MESSSETNRTWEPFFISTLLGFFVFVLYINENINTSIFLAPKNKPINSTTFVKPIIFQEPSQNETLHTAMNKSSKMKCNIFEGKWVYKPKEKPIYDSKKCPFIEEKFRCQNNGRPDNDYEKWSWEPNHCHLPLFKGREMLERLRNKRVVIVGDSLNRNMWESLSCLLYTSIPRIEVQATQTSYKVLKAKDYNAVIEYHWNPFLVEYDMKHKSGKKVVVLDKVSHNSKLWQGADIMVFNSAFQWVQNRWDLLQLGERLLQDGIPLELAYEIGLKTWAKWIHKNVNSKKTIVLFIGVSPQHNGKPNCYDVKKPIDDGSPHKNNFPKSVINVTESIIKGMKKPRVKYLDITRLSEYRMDAHPSLFGSPQRKHVDCTHWCLPGLPDTWNRLFYTTLFLNSSRNMSKFR